MVTGAEVERRAEWLWKILTLLFKAAAAVLHPLSPAKTPYTDTYVCMYVNMNTHIFTYGFSKEK